MVLLARVWQSVMSWVSFWLSLKCKCVNDERELWNSPQMCFNIVLFYHSLLWLFLSLFCKVRAGCIACVWERERGFIILSLYLSKTSSILVDCKNKACLKSPQNKKLIPLSFCYTIHHMGSGLTPNWWSLWLSHSRKLLISYCISKTKRMDELLRIYNSMVSYLFEMIGRLITRTITHGWTL